MMKTTADIEHDIWTVAKGYLTGKIGGSVYKEGTRPNDSCKEDAVVVVSFASAGQTQDSSAYVNIFVPNIDCGGESMPDKARLRLLSSFDEGLAEAVHEAYSDYAVELGSATGTMEEEGSGQHMVSIHLSITINTF